MSSIVAVPPAIGTAQAGPPSWVAQYTFVASAAMAHAWDWVARTTGTPRGGSGHEGDAAGVSFVDVSPTEGVPEPVDADAELEAVLVTDAGLEAVLVTDVGLEPLSGCSPPRSTSPWQATRLTAHRIERAACRFIFMVSAP